MFPVQFCFTEHGTGFPYQRNIATATSY